MKSILRYLLDFPVFSSKPSFPEEIHFPALGEHWKVNYRRSASRSVQARGNGKGVLTVSGKVNDPGMVIIALRRWMVRRARASLSPWLKELTFNSGLTCGKITIRGQRSRWASCSSNRNINLNFKLLFLSPELVRYVMNHELCHTVHLNHSRDFWQMLSSIEPGYRDLNRRVKKGMEEVPEWARG